MTLDEFLSWQAVGKLCVLMFAVAFAYSLGKDLYK